MGKRSRRRTSTRRQVRRTPQRYVPLESPTVPQQEVNFGEEYRYVLADLKRIGVLAVAMVAVLVGIAVLLP